MIKKITDELRNCPLQELSKKLSQQDLSRFSFDELANLIGNIMNVVYHQIQPLREQANQKFLEMKEQENLKKAS